MQLLHGKRFTISTKGVSAKGQTIYARTWCDSTFHIQERDLFIIRSVFLSTEEFSPHLMMASMQHRFDIYL